MAYNPSKGSEPLAAMQAWQAPNLIAFTRSRSPPLPLPDVPELDEKKPGGDCEESTPGNKRELRGMSVASSLNIARLLSSLDWAKNGECIHVTLTYWKKWPQSKQELARRKAQLVCDMGRKVEAGIWRLEYQTRKKETRTPLKVPHFHLLLWLLGRSREDFERWLWPWWKSFADNASSFGVKITCGDQARGTWYLAMHAAKREQSPPFAVGRWWGYINRAKLLSAQDIHNTGEVVDRARVWWARLYRRATGAKVRHEMGFSWFLPRSYQCEVGAWVQNRIEFERAARERPPF